MMQYTKDNTGMYSFKKKSLKYQNCTKNFYVVLSSEETSFFPSFMVFLLNKYQMMNSNLFI